jgi:signal transduction histidine kinase/ActR/RegA family two-component response regulator
VNARLCCLAFAAWATLGFGATSAAEPSAATALKQAEFAGPGEQAAAPVKLPHIWRHTSQSPGVARYRLTFESPAGITDFAVQINGTNLPFEAIVNGRHAHENGGPTSKPVPLTSWRAAPTFRIPVDQLQPGANTLELLVYPSRPGVYVLGQVTVGPADAITQGELRGWIVHNVVPLVVASVLGAVGLIALAMWRGRQNYALFFWLGSGAFLWALQNFLFQWPLPLLPQPHLRVVLTSFYAWYPLLLAVFFLRFAYHRWRWFEGAAVAVMLLAMPVLYLAQAFGQFDQASTVLRGGVLLFIGTALVAIVRYALRERDTKSVLLLVAGALCVGGAVYDYALDLRAVDLRPVWLTSYAGVILVLLTAWMLLDRYQQAYSAYRDLNVELETRVQAANAELQLRLAQTQAAREQAEQANVAKSRFFAAASHDLRQPLHSLGLFASALDEQLTSPQAREKARGIRESITALESLFDALLDLSRLDAGIITVQPRNVALQALFDRMAREFHVEAVERDLRLRFMPTRAVVRTDPLLLQRVLTNLVSNALRYTPRGGVVVGVRRRKGRASIEVCDTGVGIAADKQALVFEEFYQVSNPGRDRRRGLGLGLAIVRRLALLLDHPLTLVSTPGRGTAFRIELPFADGPADAPMEEETQAEDAALSGVRALVVDDDLMVREGTAALLKQWHAEAVTAASPAEAVRALDDGFVPDVLIVDLRLGGAEDGIDLVAGLRRRMMRETPALLVSGDTGAAELMRVRYSGIPFLTKPVAPAKLRSVLLNLTSVAAAAPATAPPP